MSWKWNNCVSPKTFQNMTLWNKKKKNNLTKKKKHFYEPWRNRVLAFVENRVVRRLMKIVPFGQLYTWKSQNESFNHQTGHSQFGNCGFFYVKLILEENIPKTAILEFLNLYFGNFQQIELNCQHWFHAKLAEKWLNFHTVSLSLPILAVCCEN